LAKRAPIWEYSTKRLAIHPSLGYFLSGMTRHVLCTGVNFDAGDDARIDDDFDKWFTIFLLLADGLVTENRATNVLTETGRGTINSR